ncbi:gamma-tubulin complex, DGRIP91/SPC98 component [Cyathus striatus]|nr:gamma-tubulin complex, DGRIP91/SPC98 component [Cyathus striatus]
MSHVTTSIDSLITTLVPSSRTNSDLKRDLSSLCQEILNSNIGQAHDSDLGHLTDVLRRQLLHHSPEGSRALKFTNLLSRLLDESALSRNNESIQFLHALAFSESRPKSATLPTLRVPPFPERKVPSSLPHATKDAGKAGKSRASLLREYRYSRDCAHIPEKLLLRDTLYLLQGISGKYIRFAEQNDKDKGIVFLDDAAHQIPSPKKALIHRLSELGYLCNRVESFIHEREGAGGVGMIEQSLCHHLQTQLTEYYRLVAVLETQITTEDSNTAISNNLYDGRTFEEIALSLQRLDVWVNEWRLRLRMMSVCVEGAREAQGGSLVNLIHSYTDNGDPFIRKFTDRLLDEVSRPFFATLHKWLFYGELHDPFSEFFVSLDADVAKGSYGYPSGTSGNEGGLVALNGDVDDYSTVREGGLKLWEGKYRFRKDMLPMFVGETFGKKIFSTGKSLNFIRYTCHDNDWVITREKMSTMKGALQYNDIAGLERSIDAAYRIASQRLFEVFIDKFKLLDHLFALKNYLMLGHGDFSDHLMEALGPSLGKPANTLYRHNLTATLETAIRSSNAQHDSVDVLRRLDVRMLEYSHGEIGWDVFTLEYKVDSPIDTVLDPESMEKYLKIFRHLWQLKRAEMALDRGWMRITGGAKTFLRVQELQPRWHRIRLMMAEMIHFTRQIQAYCRLEVIECSWKILIDFLSQKEGDLDALIDAHRSYLDRVTKKIHLWHPKSGKEDFVLNTVKEALSITLQFRETTDNLYNYCLSEAARRDQILDTERGIFTGSKEAPVQNQDLSELLERLAAYGHSFREKMQSTVQQLQVHPDLDCRFLGIRLSFSDYYKTKK